jgi:hypothetical protein
VVDAQGPEDQVPVEIPAGAELEQPGLADRSEVLAEGAEVVLLEALLSRVGDRRADSCG